MISIIQARIKEGLSFRAAMLALNQAALLWTITVLAWEQNWPINLPDFDSASVPFVHILPRLRHVELLALGAIITYALAGWPNLDRLKHHPRRGFALASLGLLLLTALSLLWATHRGLAIVHVAHMAVWILFALMIACGDWPAPRLAVFFLGGLLIHCAVGFTQMLLQHFVGLGPRFGELPVRPHDPWVSVVFFGAARILRTYGLSGHPNVLGGHAAVGLMLTYGLAVVWPRVWRTLILIAWFMVWILLLITFSRSAWLATVAGGLAAAALLARGRWIDRRTIVPVIHLAIVGLVLVIAFAIAFQPFLVGRFQTSTEPYEAHSIREREAMIHVAGQLIAAQPLTGVGAANFSVASRAFGDPLGWAHNVPLLIASELGLVGLALFVAMLGAMGATGWIRWQARSIGFWQALVGGGLVGLMTVMLFDHYLWTAPQGTLLWALLAGWWMAASTEN